MDVMTGDDGAAAATLTIPQRYDHLYALFSSERFLKLQGIGSEVPFYICPHGPQDAVAMQKLAHQLAGRLAVEKGIQVLEIDLYDLSVEMLQARDIWGQLLEIEPDTPKDALLEMLQNVLDPETHLVPAIADKMGDQQYDILFLTGVGEVFHQLRSHAIENFNPQFKGIFDVHRQVPTKGLVNTRRFALGAIFVYQLCLWHRFELGLDLRCDLKAFLKAA